MCYRPGVDPPADTFQVEGLLAIDTGAHATYRVAASDPYIVPSIRATRLGNWLVVTTDASVDTVTATDAHAAFAQWAYSFVAATAPARHERRPQRGVRGTSTSKT
jgi:hypothetical protein